VVLLAVTPTRAQTPSPAPGPPLIVARAEASVKRDPDRAWLTVATETRDARAEEARRKSAEITTAAQSAIRGVGIPGDALRTTGFSLTPEMNYNNGRGEIRGYVVRNRVEVRIDDLGKLAAVIDSIQTRAGTGLSVIGPRFDLKNEREAQAEALKLAVPNARAKAEAMAAGAGRSLGPIVRIEEAGAMLPPRPEPMPMAFRAQEAASAGPATPVVPGEIEITASVTLTAEIR
jgi:uncharacterized protein YggE